MKRRNLILLLGGASSGAMSVGTGAFSSVEAERGVEVNVVDDEDAYLGLDDDAGEGLVRIKNQFAEDLTLTVTAALASGSGEVDIEVDEEGESEADGDDEDDHEDAGEIEIEIGLDDEGDDSSHDDSVEVTIPTGNFLDVIAECDEAGEATLELDFSGTVSDTGTTVDKTREFSIDCGSDENRQGDSSVTFKPGKSEITINAGDGRKPEATVYYQGNGEASIEKKSSEDKPVNEVLKLKQDFGGPNNGRKIVAVAIDGVDGVFVSQNFDPESCEVTGNSENTVNVKGTSGDSTLDNCVN